MKIDAELSGLILIAIGALNAFVSAKAYTESHRGWRTLAKYGAVLVFLGTILLVGSWFR